MKKLILLLFVVITLQSCYFAKAKQIKKMKKVYTVENNAIPPRFGVNKDEVLIVILKDNNPYYNGYVKRAVKKNYKGNYLLVKESEFYGNKFSDVDKYRFVFDFSEGRSYSNMTNTGYSSGSYKRFFVKDRLHNKTYQVMEDFNFFVKAMHIYFANLELKRTTTN